MGNHCEWQGGPRRQEETEVSRICPWPCLASCCLATEAEKARFVITVPSTTQFKTCHFIITSRGIILCLLWLNCGTINQCWDSTHSERLLNYFTTIILHVPSYFFTGIIVPKSESVYDYYSIATIETWALWYSATETVAMGCWGGFSDASDHVRPSSSSLRWKRRSRTTRTGPIVLNQQAGAVVCLAEFRSTELRWFPPQIHASGSERGALGYWVLWRGWYTQHTQKYILIKYWITAITLNVLLQSTWYDLGEIGTKPWYSP